MGIKCGIVGLPNVGKSTLFNALTRAQIAAENYPFCTIDPNVGVVPVPDPRLDAARGHREAGEDPADDGGVRGHRGPRRRRLAGRGARQPVPVAHPRDGCDRARGALLRETRHHARGRARSIRSPTSTSSTPSWRSRICDAWRRRWIAPPRPPRAATRTPSASARCSSASKAHLDPAKPARAMQLTDEERRDLRELQLLTAKPVMYVANVAENGLHRTTRYLAAVREARGGRRAPSWWRCARPSKRRSRSWKKPIAPSSWRTWVWRSPGWTA